ncbi:MAG: dienelactone hydrolase family protein [Acidobacteriota bacterium]
MIISEATTRTECAVSIGVGHVGLQGILSVPENSSGLVVFAQGSGSSRNTPRNRFLAGALGEAGLGTLQLDLLTMGEELVDFDTGHLRFDIDLLAERLMAATDWLAAQPSTRDLRIGYLGASTGAAAALVAAARRPDRVGAVVSRGGRPSLAGAALPRVQAPTLLIVGGDDPSVIDSNRQAIEQLRCRRKLEIIPGATHLFEEPGALARVAELAGAWFAHHLPLASPSTRAIAKEPVLG